MERDLRLEEVRARMWQRWCVPSPQSCSDWRMASWRDSRPEPTFSRRRSRPGVRKVTKESGKIKGSVRNI
jgi:hypothetical protein